MKAVVLNLGFFRYFYAIKLCPFMNLYKNIEYTGRRILLFLALSISSFSVSSCADMLLDFGGNGSLTADIERLSDGIPVKSSLGPDYGVLWSAEDSVAVYRLDGSRETFSVSAMDKSGKRVIFDVPVSDVSSAVFPAGYADELENCIRIPDTQVYSKYVRTDIMPMVLSSDGSYDIQTFRHLAGVYSLRLMGHGEKVTRVSFHSDSFLAGTAIISEGKDARYLNFVNDPVKTLVLDCSADGGVVLSEDAVSFNIVMVPLSSSDYYIEVETAQGQVMRIESSDVNNSLPYRAAVIKTPILTFDEDL